MITKIIKLIVLLLAIIGCIYFLVYVFKDENVFNKKMQDSQKQFLTPNKLVENYTYAILNLDFETAKGLSTEENKHRLDYISNQWQKLKENDITLYQNKIKEVNKFSDMSLASKNAVISNIHIPNAPTTIKIIFSKNREIHNYNVKVTDGKVSSDDFSFLIPLEDDDHIMIFE